MQPNKRPKIGLLELKSHHEVLRTYLLGFLAAEAEVHCFTNSFNAELNQDLIEQNHSNWYIQKAGQNQEQFLNSLKASFQELDYLIITTYFSELPFYLFKKQKVGLLIHSWHFIVQPWYQMVRGSSSIALINRWIKIPKTIIRRQKMLKQLSQATHLIAGAQSIVNYLNQQSYKSTQSIRLLELYINEKITPVRQNASELKIAIPGSIQKNSRDYDLLVEVFKQLAGTTDQNIQLLFPTIANNPTSKQIKEQLQPLAPKIQTIFYEEYLDQEQYDQLLLKADFLFCPIQRYSYNGHVREVNGQSHLSANVNDMIRLGIPAVFPNFYILPPAIKSIVGTYSTMNNCVALLRQWISQKTYNEIKGEMSQHLQSYQREAVGKRFRQFLVDLQLYEQ